ncbi:MAG: hypothetical protein JSS56_01810 [Proteobacteria bacterium]|nr:hypothetical protein [Pseudomonadota bacterium]
MLIPVRQEYNPHELKPIHAAFLGKGGRLPARVRAVLDYLRSHVDLRGAQPLPRAEPGSSAPVDWRRAPSRK